MSPLELALLFAWAAAVVGYGLALWVTYPRRTR